MVLSPERESELIENNMANIYHAADIYAARCVQLNPVFSYEDLVQQVMEAYLLYIRRCKTEADLKIFPWYDAKHAMCDLVLRSQPLSVPKSTKTFNEVLHSLPKTVSFDVMMANGVEVDGMSKTWVQDKDTEIDFEEFMASQDDLNNRLVAMRLRGKSIRGIAEYCEVKKSAIGDRINKMYKEYLDYTKEDDSDE